MDARTGRLAPQQIVLVPELEEQTELEVIYTDVRGQPQGPFQLLLDRQQELIRDARRKLDLTRHAWVRWSAAGDRVYFTHLAAYREALQDVRYATEGDLPHISYELPDLAKGPVDRPSEPVPPETRSIVIQLTFRDGTQSEIVRIDRPVARTR